MSFTPLSLRAATRAVALLVMGVFMLCPAPARAGSVEPPLELLYAPGNVLVAGSLLEINPAGRLVLLRKDVLASNTRPPARIDVRVPPSMLDTVRIGERYIVGYSIARADPRNPNRVIADPAGAVVLTSPGLEPAALFRDTPAVRAILKAGRSERGRESRRLFDLLMQALTGSDRALQMLAAGEIALDREIAERVREHGRADVEKVARDPHSPAEVRTLLLQTAANRPADLGDWWQTAAIEIVATTPVGGYAAGASDAAGLVLAALELLDRQVVKLPSDVLARWVRSDNPSLVERACLMLRRDNPATERSAIREALADANLPAQTRKFLNGHLRRLDRLDAALKSRKQGAG